ncbi:MAG: response regulator transcription factor [Desulforhopalus sp.]
MVASNFTIYVIDDDYLVRDALTTLLRSAGFTPQAFESAQDFLHSDYKTQEAIVILDVRMPGMGGLHLQSHLSELGVKLPIIFMTAHDDSQVRTTAIAAGAAAFLQKPFEDDTLLDEIHRLEA